MMRRKVMRGTRQRGVLNKIKPGEVSLRNEKERGKKALKM